MNAALDKTSLFREVNLRKRTIDEGGRKRLQQFASSQSSVSCRFVKAILVVLDVWKK